MVLNEKLSVSLVLTHHDTINAITIVARSLSCRKVIGKKVEKKGGGGGVVVKTPSLCVCIVCAFPTVHKNIKKQNENSGVFVFCRSTESSPQKKKIFFFEGIFSLRQIFFFLSFFFFFFRECFFGTPG